MHFTLRKLQLSYKSNVFGLIVIKIDLTGDNGVSALIPKAQAGDAAIKHLRDELQVMLDTTPEKDATTQYVFERVQEAVQLNQALETYIVANSTAIVNPFSNSGRVALANELETIFSTVSTLDFKKIKLTSTQAHTATQALLKTLETFQSIFPEQIDKKLKTAQAALTQKIKAYKPEGQVEHELAEADVKTYVRSEPLKPIKTLSTLAEYVDAELKKIAEQTEPHVKFAAYQALKSFAKNICDDEIEALEDDDEEEEATLLWQDLWMDPVHAITTMAAVTLMIPTMMPDQTEEEFNQRSDALLNKISEAMMQEVQSIIDKAEEARDVISHMPELYERLKHYQDLKERMETNTKALNEENEACKQFIASITQTMQEEIVPVIEKLDQLTDDFKQQVNLLRMKKKPVIKKQVETLISNLDAAKKALQATGNLDAFQQTTYQLFEDFPEEAAFEINGSNTWFQKYIIRPFERLKEKISSLMQSIHKKSPEKTQAQPSFFSAPKGKKKRTLDVLQEGLEDLGHDKPSKPAG